MTSKMLKELILKCGIAFETLEIRSDGWVVLGILKNPNLPLKERLIPENILKIKGIGESLEEAVENFYKGILKSWIDLGGKDEESLKEWIKSGKTINGYAKAIQTNN